MTELARNDEAKAMVDLLRRSGDFAGIPAADLLLLARTARRSMYARRQMIESQELIAGILLVERGGIRLYRSSVDGSEVTLLSVGPGELFGMIMASAAIARVSILEAVEEDTRVSVLPRSVVRDLALRHPVLALQVLDHLGERLGELCDRIEDLALRPVRTRLAHELAHLASENQAGWVYDTHGELAAHIGSKQVEVTRGLRALRDEQLIASEPHCRGITVLDPAELASYNRQR
jgi:CRP/FNR family transcriptional regulator